MQNNSWSEQTTFRHTCELHFIYTSYARIGFLVKEIYQILDGFYSTLKRHKNHRTTEAKQSS